MNFFVQKVHGPFSDKQIQSGLSSGELKDSDRISDSPDGPWRTIAEIKAVVTPEAPGETEALPDPEVENRSANEPDASSGQPEECRSPLCVHCKSEIHAEATICPHCRGPQGPVDIWKHYDREQVRQDAKRMFKESVEITVDNFKDFFGGFGSRKK